MSLKTQPNDASVDDFIAAVEPAVRRQDCIRAREIMQRLSGAPAVMWGDSIVGFGSYDYRYASGHTGSWFLTGFAPRMQNITLYIMCGFGELGLLLERLGRHKIAKSCLYLSSLEVVDLAVLEQLVRESLRIMKQRYPGE